MKHLIFTGLILFSFLSCKKKETTAETPLITGSISGKVDQYNQSGEKLSSVLNQVSISLDNDIATATTDEKGNYSLSNVKPGIYTIFFNKPGCKTFQIQQVNFPGNGTLFKDAELVETPTAEFLSATLKYGDTLWNDHSFPKLTIHIKLKPVTITTWFTIVYGSGLEIDFDKNGTYSTFQSYQILPNTSDYKFNLVMASGAQYNFARIYPYSGYTSGYYDYNNKTSIKIGYGKPLPAQKIE